MVLKVGMAGLGGGARGVLPSFKNVPGVELAAVADVRPKALADFAHLDVQSFTSAEEMCASADVDAVWIATPNHLHMDHVILAAHNGKHVICEKPMALNLQQAERMIAAVERNGVKYVQGHSKIYDPPVKMMRKVVASGELGRLIQLNTWNFRNWLNQPRLATEVDSATGGGVAYRQGPHQTDVIRGIGGGMVKSVRAIAGRWSPYFPDTEGDFTAFLEFEDGTPCTMVMNGYARFNVVELTWGIGEGGGQISEERLYGKRERLTRAMDWDEKYSLPEYTVSLEEQEGRREREFQPFYGLTVASCERGDIRQSPDGLFIYTDEGREERPVTEDRAGHAGELRELYQSVTENRPSFPDARWGMATLEVIMAILRSSRQGKEIRLSHQVPYKDDR